MKMLSKNIIAIDNMRILAFPKGDNPYQELLYVPMRGLGDEISYISDVSTHKSVNLLMFVPQLMLWKWRGYNIFHLHWASAFSLISNRWYLKPLGTIAYWHYLFCLSMIKLLGFRLVWTAHNVLPHDPAFPNDTIARRKLVAAADLVILHSERTLGRLEDLGAKPKRSVLIPVGSFVGIYPQGMSRRDARRKLGIKSDAFVYLHLGLIRKYKGVDDLLKAYKEIENENNRLIIVGACSDLDLKKELRGAISSPRITWYDEYVPDVDLQLYHAASDIVVLPFKAITLSSSALLAFSFGKTVITPRIGDMADLPDSIVYKYPPEDKDALRNMMKLVENDGNVLNQKSEAALRYVEKLSWPSIALRTHDAIKQLFLKSK